MRVGFSGGGGVNATQTWRRFLLMHRKLFPPHWQCFPRGCYYWVTACKVFSLPESLPLFVQMGSGSLGTLWLRIKGGERRFTEFATLPIIQMILNANYPPRLCREQPVTQDVARVCQPRRRLYHFGAEGFNIDQTVAGQLQTICHNVLFAPLKKHTKLPNTHLKTPGKMQVRTPETASFRTASKHQWNENEKKKLWMFVSNKMVV